MRVRSRGPARSTGDDHGHQENPALGKTIKASGISRIHILVCLEQKVDLILGERDRPISGRRLLMCGPSQT